MGKVRVTKIQYNGWENCLLLTNDIVECVLTTDVGPRVIRYGFCGQKNEFYEIPEDMGKTGGKDYRFYGGHRLWHGPQIEPRCMLPDNDPVQYDISDHTVVLKQDIESGSGIRKIIKLTMGEETSEVKLEHCLQNHGTWAARLTVWPLTMMRSGGIEYIPFSTAATGLLPNRLLVLWPWTDPRDYRIGMGKRYLTVRQDENAKEVGPHYENALKLGVNNDQGYAAYFNDSQLFIKTFDTYPEQLYPDMGCSFETYTNPQMLELEALSPLYTVEPGQSVTQKEAWKLYDDISAPLNDEDAETILNKLK